MGIKVTNGNTQVKYINITIGKLKISLTYFQALKGIAKTIASVIILLQWIIPAYYKAETMYYNVVKIPAIVETVDSTKTEFTNLKNTVFQKWKWQDSVYQDNLKP